MDESPSQGAAANYSKAFCIVISLFCLNQPAFPIHPSIHPGFPPFWTCSVDPAPDAETPAGICCPHLFGVTLGIVMGFLFIFFTHQHFLPLFLAPTPLFIMLFIQHDDSASAPAVRELQFRKWVWGGRQGRVLTAGVLSVWLNSIMSGETQHISLTLKQHFQFPSSRALSFLRFSPPCCDTPVPQKCVRFCRNQNSGCWSGNILDDCSQFGVSTVALPLNGTTTLA